MRMQQISGPIKRATWLALVIAVGSCADSPTGSLACEPSATLGVAFTQRPASAAALEPALQDARSRLLPALTNVPTEFIGSVDALAARLAVGNRDGACQAFNAVAAGWLGVSSGIAFDETPDLEALRLSLRLAQSFLASPESTR